MSERVVTATVQTVHSFCDHCDADLGPPNLVGDTPFHWKVSVTPERHRMCGAYEKAIGADLCEPCWDELRATVLPFLGRK